MQIAKHAVVAIDYTLKDDAGEVLDTSAGSEPLVYIHGLGNLIAGLEAELDGKKKGAKLEVVVAPKDGYGELDSKLIHQVPKRQFEGNVAVGQRFHAGPNVITITQVQGDMVTVDGNHPLAGKRLHFKVEVLDVRAATAEELDHGHAHGPGGHHHH